MFANDITAFVVYLRIVAAQHFSAEGWMLRLCLTTFSKPSWTEFPSRDGGAGLICQGIHRCTNRGRG